MINIINSRPEIFNLLESLDKSKNPVFGKMTPQHMVEHLSIVVAVSNGKYPQKLISTPEKAELVKTGFIYTDKEMPIGIKAPMLGEEPEALVFPDLKSAIEVLRNELNKFDGFFQDNYKAKPIHPIFGELTYAEWIIFHNKHFTHHLKQYNLI